MNEIYVRVIHEQNDSGEKSPPFFFSNTIVNINQ